MLAVDQGLYVALTGDATLTALVGARVYEGEAPEGSPMPVVIFAQAGAGKDVNTFSALVWSELEYDVKAVTEGADKTAAETIYERIHFLINNKPGIIPGNAGAYLRRLGLIDYPERTLARRFHHVGGRYAVFVR